MDGFDWAYWHWLILGFILLMAEIMLPGVFLLWWGLSALLIAAISYLFPAFPTIGLWIGFSLLSVVLTLGWWKYQHCKDKQDQQQTRLNQRDHAMLGKKGVVEEIHLNGIGRGYFGDTTWRIQGEHLHERDLVEVVAVEGITLIVRKVAPSAS